MTIDIVVPTLGESVTEATVAKWFKGPGDAVALDEPLVELETDKVSIEVGALAAGALLSIVVEAGEDVAVGAVLGTIDETKAGAEADVVLIDTPAGIGHDVISLAAAAQDVIIVAMPEPTSIRDAYALIKVLWQRSESPSLRLLVNRASTRQAADAASGQIASVARRFLNLEIDSLGYLPDDSRVSSAVRKQEALIVAYPNSPAARGVEMLAEALIDVDAPLPGHRGLMGFVHRIVRSRDRAVAV